MLKKIIGLGLIIASICIAGFVSSNDETVDDTLERNGAAVSNISDPDDDFLLLTVPAIAGAINRAPPPPPPPVVVNPRWSVVSEVCCETSSATFRVNQGSDNRSSTAASCSVAAPQSTEVESTAGNKNFSYSLASATCGDIAEGFNFTFQEKTRYIFVAQFVNNGVSVGVFSGPINRTAGVDNTVDNVDQGLSYERTIRLSNAIEGESSFRTIDGHSRLIKK